MDPGSLYGPQSMARVSAEHKAGVHTEHLKEWSKLKKSWHTCNFAFSVVDFMRSVKSSVDSQLDAFCQSQLTRWCKWSWFYLGRWTWLEIPINKYDCEITENNFLRSFNRQLLIQRERTFQDFNFKANKTQSSQSLLIEVNALHGSGKIFLYYKFPTTHVLKQLILHYI